MLGNIIVTVLLFSVAIGLCITLNYTLVVRTWDFMTLWMRQLLFVALVVLIFSSLYFAIGYLWGAIN